MRVSHLFSASSFLFSTLVLSFRLPFSSPHFVAPHSVLSPSPSFCLSSHLSPPNTPQLILLVFHHISTFSLFTFSQAHLIFYPPLYSSILSVSNLSPFPSSHAIQSHLSYYLSPDFLLLLVSSHFSAFTSLHGFLFLSPLTFPRPLLSHHLLSPHSLCLSSPSSLTMPLPLPFFVCPPFPLFNSPLVPTTAFPHCYSGLIPSHLPLVSSFPAPSLLSNLTSIRPPSYFLFFVSPFIFSTSSPSHPLLFVSPLSVAASPLPSLPSSVWPRLSTGWPTYLLLHLNCPSL